MNFSIGMRIPPHIGKQGIQEVAHFAQSAGIDVLDLPVVSDENKHICDNAGLSIGSVDAKGVGQLLSKDETKQANALESAKAQMNEMNRLGANILFMCLIPEDRTLPRKEGFEIFKQVFPAVVDHAEANDIYIAIEGYPGPAPHYPTLGCTPEMIRAMFEAIPSKHFGLNYDPSHLVRLGIDYIRVINEFGERIHYCHGKDTEILMDEQYEVGTLPATFGAKYGFSEGAWRYTIPGHGEVDWAKVAVRLERVGYTGAISIELEDQRFWGSLEAEQQGIRKSVEYLQRIFQ